MICCDICDGKETTAFGFSHRLWCPRLIEYRETAPAFEVALTPTGFDLKQEYGEVYPQLFWNAFLKKMPCENCIWNAACILLLGHCASPTAVRDGRASTVRADEMNPTVSPSAPEG